MKPIINRIFHLAECPLWNAGEQALYWTDILNGELWRYDDKSGESTLFWKGGLQIGGFAFSRNGDLILCSDKGVFRLQSSGNTEREPKLLYEAPFGRGERFNDVTTDPRGRILAGTKRDDLKNGKLFLFERGKQPEILLEGIGISNGMTFSLDHRYFYHTDSLECTINRYDYDINTGRIKNPIVFYRGSPNEGYPDGITLDADGFMWVAFWGASCIRRISFNGQIVNELEVQAIQPSSLMFGGKNLDKLFVTTACEGGKDLKTGLDENGNFLGGLVFYTQLSVKGRTEWLANH